MTSKHVFILVTKHDLKGVFYITPNQNIIFSLEKLLFPEHIFFFLNKTTTTIKPIYISAPIILDIDLTYNSPTYTTTSPHPMNTLFSNLIPPTSLITKTSPFPINPPNLVLLFWFIWMI